MVNLFRCTYYVRIEPDRLTLTHVESGREVSDIPVLAIDESRGKPRVLSVGLEAMQKTGAPGVRIVNGFKHPRTPLADFLAAELTLKHFMARLASASWFTPSPVVVMHPLQRMEGGLTSIEIRAFQELAAGAGARKVYIWEGDELSLDLLRDLDFGRAAGRLLDQ